jgi:hypothetical protein
MIIECNCAWNPPRRSASAFTARRTNRSNSVGENPSSLRPKTPRRRMGARHANARTRCTINHNHLWRDGGPAYRALWRGAAAYSTATRERSPRRSSEASIASQPVPRISGLSMSCSPAYPALSLWLAIGLRGPSRNLGCTIRQPPRGRVRRHRRSGSHEVVRSAIQL